MWHFDQNTCAITGFSVGTYRSAMLQANQNIDCLVNDLVGSFTVKIADKSCATIISFKIRGIQPLSFHFHT